MRDFFKALATIFAVSFIVGGLGVAYCVTHCTDLGCR